MKQTLINYEKQETRNIKNIKKICDICGIARENRPTGAKFPMEMIDL